jgi:hypothetical protein
MTTGFLMIRGGLRKKIVAIRPALQFRNANSLQYFHFDLRLDRGE